MSFKKDSPLSSEKDFSEDAIMERHNKAAMAAIVNHNAVVFNSLSDIPYLLKLVKSLKEQLGDK
jgi:hypothetical protein